MNDFREAAVAAGFVLALLATQWWVWLLVSLLGTGTALLYALAALGQWRPVLALVFLLLAGLVFGLAQAMTYWLQPDRRARPRPDAALPRVIWRQGIAFGGTWLLALGVAAWPAAWPLPGALATARLRMGGAPLPANLSARPAKRVPVSPFPGINLDRLSDGTRYAVTQSLNRPELCPRDRGATFLADCQRYATTMAEARRESMSLDGRPPGRADAPAGGGG